MGPYRVFYLNVFMRSFTTRDEAVSFIIRTAGQSLHAIGDYEILDRSDSL